MRLLLLTHYYAPEFGAPQRRWSALVRRFVAAGVHEQVTRWQSGARAVVTTIGRFAEVLRERGVGSVHVVRSGRAWVAEHADDDVLAGRCLEILHRVLQDRRLEAAPRTSLR